MTTSELRPPRSRPASGPSQDRISFWTRRRWMTPAAFIALGAVLFFAYLAEAKKLPIFGDGAAQALQAWDMLHGNTLLHGWVLSDVSFYSTELPQYLLIEFIAGLNPEVVHIAAAMTYALLVVLTAVLAKGKATGSEALVRVLIPLGIMLAPVLGPILSSRGNSFAWIVLSAPDHTGTQVPLVLTWLALDRLRPRWWLPILITVMLIWVEIADSTAIFEGAVPIAAVCVLRMYRRRGPLSGQWHDICLGVGAAASAGIATAALAAIRTHGGFVVNPAPPSLATVAGMTINYWVKVRNLLSLFGADFFGMTISHALIPIAHLVAVALVVWGVTRAVRRFFSDDDLAMQVVTASFVVLLAAYIFGYRDGTREAVGLLPMGAVLAGRMLAPRVLQARLAPVLAAALACYGASLVAQVVGPALPSPDGPLASWLRAHHLTYGVSATWFASNGITLYSHDQVRVRDVRITASGGLANWRWNTEASWYSPQRHDARFLILNPCAPPPTGRLFDAVGPPTATYFADGLTVLVWRTNLLASHPVPASLSSRTYASVDRERDQLHQILTSDTNSVVYQLMCGSSQLPVS